jgi:hypothetical protein
MGIYVCDPRFYSLKTSLNLSSLKTTLERNPYIHGAGLRGFTGCFYNSYDTDLLNQVDIKATDY